MPVNVITSAPLENVTGITFADIIVHSAVIISVFIAAKIMPLILSRLYCIIFIDPSNVTEFMPTGPESPTNNGNPEE